MKKDLLKEGRTSARAESFVQEDFKVASWLVRYIDRN